MINFLVNRPISVVAAFLALLILSVFNLLYLPTSFLPNIDIPEVKVLVEDESYDARKFENTVAKPLRIHLAQVSNLDDVESISQNGVLTLNLRFKIGTDISRSFIEVNEKLAFIDDQLPENIKRPRVLKMKASDIPAFYINFYLHNYEENRLLSFSKLIENKVLREIEQLPEVALVDVSGLKKPMVQITPRYSKIRALGLSNSAIEDKISINNNGIKSVQLKDGNYAFNLRFGSQLTSIEQLSHLSFSVGDQTVKLWEIADIRWVFQSNSSSYFYNQFPAIGLAIIQKPGTSHKNIKHKVDKILHEFSQEYPTVNYTISQNQIDKMSQIIDQLKTTLVLGCLLSFIVVFIFMKNWKIASIICTTIPISLLITILFFRFFGISINLLSLFGLILSLGLMIDNAIIVTDNIMQHVKFGHKKLKQVCILGSVEVANSLFTSSLTTCVIFLPLTFLSDLSGALFSNQAIAIGIGLTVSLFTSLVLLPSLIYLFKVNIKTNANDKLLNLYRQTYFSIFKQKIKLITLSILFIMLGGFTSNYLKHNKWPLLPENEFVLNIDWNENVNKLENETRVLQLVKKFSKVSTTMISLVGKQGFLMKNLNLTPSKAQIYFKCHDSLPIKHFQEAITIYLQSTWKYAKFGFEKSETLFTKIFGKENNNLNAIIRPINISEEELIITYQDLLIDSLLNDLIDKDLAIPMEEIYLLKIKLETLLFYEITVNQVVSKIQSLSTSTGTESLRSRTHPIPIVLKNRSGPIVENLKSTWLINTRGIRIPLHTLVTLEKKNSLKEIHADLGSEYISIPLKENKALNTISQFKAHSVNNGNYDIDFDGGYFKAKAIKDEILIVLGVSVFLLYFILAAQFESFISPIIILIELPISLSGSILAIFLFGHTLNVMTLIGMVIMCGIVINDSILKIDTVNKSLKKGKGLKRSIHEAGIRRINPIIMTSLTTILALIPIFFVDNTGSRLQTPLAISIIGGLIIGTLVSIYLIPLFYFLFMQKLKGPDLDAGD